MIDADSATERGEDEAMDEWYLNFVAEEGDCCEASEYSQEARHGVRTRSKKTDSWSAEVTIGKY